IFAIAAAAATLAAIVYVPPLLRPGTPVTRFPRLPGAVASDLNRRGCNIVRGKNVISEHFSGDDRLDWAVLCQQGGQASLMVYRAGAGQPFISGTHAAGLNADPESARGIRVVEWEYVARHNPGLPMRSTPGPCIEDAAGMGSAIYCYLNGTWRVLAGAD